MVGRGTKIREGADVGVGTVKKGYKFLIGDGGTAGKKRGRRAVTSGLRELLIEEIS